MECTAPLYCKRRDGLLQIAPYTSSVMRLWVRPPSKAMRFRKGSSKISG